MGTPTTTAVAPAPAAPAAEFRPGWPSKSTPSKLALYFVFGLVGLFGVLDIVLLYQAATGTAVITGYALAGTQQFIRWIHFIAGIAWIGLLYFFNWINVPYAKEAEFGTVKAVHVPKLLGRALFWFRWTAMLTVVAGWGLIFIIYAPLGRLVTFTTNPSNPLLAFGEGGPTIFFGMLLGMIMWFNVWFIIWPNQKKVLYAMETKQTVDPNWGKTALHASRGNAILSFPMLFFMGAASHLPLSLAGIALFIALGAAFSYLVIQISGKS